MSAVVEDLLRLAWQADAGGRPGMRDALLTMVVAGSGPDDAVVAERCRRLLVANRPGHCFAGSATLGQALARPRVKEGLTKLGWMYPPARVRHLLLRAEAARGPYTGRSMSLTRVLEDLAVDLGPAFSGAGNGAARRRGAPVRALPYPGAAPSAAGHAGNPDPDGKMALFYLSVLLGIAVLLNGVLRPSATDTKAA